MEIPGKEKTNQVGATNSSHRKIFWRFHVWFVALPKMRVKLNCTKDYLSIGERLFRVNISS